MDDVDIDSEQKVTIEKSIKKGLIVPKVFLYLMPLTCIVYISNLVKDFYVNLPPFIPEQYHFDFIPYFLKVSIVIYQLCNAPFLLAFDFVIICTIVHLEAQLEVLGYKLKKVVDSGINQRDEVVKCMVYHTFLLEYD